MPGVAVVGTGFGCRIHVPALRAAGFDVVALVGRDPERTARRAARAGIPTALTSLADALRLPDVDAVSIVTPPDTHAALAIEAAGAGRHVLCEKPFALSADEAFKMLEAATSAGVVGLVGHEFRFSTERALAARVIRGGGIGAPRLATFVQHVALVADPGAAMPAWWFSPAHGGGWLGASGSHLVDQLRTWLGEVREVDAQLDVVSARSATAAEDTFTLLLRMQDGATAVLQQTAAAWGPATGLTRVVGTKGTLWIDGTDVWVATAEGAGRVAVPPELVLPAAPPPSDDPRHRFSHLELGPSIRQAECFRQLIAGESLSRDLPAPATFEDGLACMEVLDRARAASAVS